MLVVVLGCWCCCGCIVAAVAAVVAVGGGDGGAVVIVAGVGGGVGCGADVVGGPPPGPVFCVMFVVCKFTWRRRSATTEARTHFAGGGAGSGPPRAVLRAVHAPRSADDILHAARQ